MQSNSKLASEAGKRSKRCPVIKELPPIKEKAEIDYEKVLDDLLVHQNKLTKIEHVKHFVTLSGYVFPKIKPVRNKFFLKQLKEMKADYFDNSPYPTK